MLCHPDPNDLKVGACPCLQNINCAVTHRSLRWELVHVCRTLNALPTLTHRSLRRELVHIYASLIGLHLLILRALRTLKLLLVLGSLWPTGQSIKKPTIHS